MSDSAPSGAGTTADERARKANRPVQVQVLFDALVSAELASLRVADRLSGVQARLGSGGLPTAPIRTSAAAISSDESAVGDAAIGGRSKRHSVHTPPTHRVEFPWFDLPPNVPEGPKRNVVAADRAEQASRSVLRKGPTMAALSRERDNLYWEIQDWRTAIDAARAAIPDAQPFTDSHRDAPIDRLSTKLGVILGELGGLIPHAVHGDLPPPDAPIVAELRRLARLVCDEHQRLKHIRGYLLTPMAARTGSLDGSTATMPAPAGGGEKGEGAPTDPTMGDLASEAGISDDTFRRVRKAARIEVRLKGSAARDRRYPPREVDRLIRAALAGNFLERAAMAEKWARWASK